MPSALSLFLVYSFFLVFTVSAHATTDTVVQSWATQKYQEDGNCRFDEFVYDVTRNTQAISSSVISKRSKNFTMGNWKDVLKVCNGSEETARCFVEADWVLHEEMAKLAPKYECKAQDVRMKLIENSCRGGDFKSTVTSENGKVINLCSLDTKCARSALFEEGRYNLKCKSSGSCVIATVKDCHFFRMDPAGFFTKKPDPSLNHSSSGAK